MIRRVATGTIRIRQGRADDLAGVREFTQNTFRWGDYLPDAWAGWARSRRGDLLVAEIEGKVVGTAHLRYLENKEAWLEGVRVRHEFRQRGIASILLQALEERARANKCAVIRLETGVRNLAARSAFEKHGFKRVVRYAEYEASPRPGELVSVRPAKLADAITCREIWQNSWIRRSTRSVVPAAYGWRWWEFTAKRLAEDIRAKRVWLAKGGFIILRAEDAGLDIRLLVGTKRAALALLDAARGLAQQDHKEKVFWLAPHVGRSGEWASAAGYTPGQDDLLVYALTF